MKIYVITKGCYSDYHICAVTEDEDMAYILAKKYTVGYEDAHIEEYDTEINNKIIYCDLFLCTCELNNPDKISIRRVDFELYENDEVRMKFTTTLLTDVLARNEEQALKIASDRFAKYRAEKMGL